MKYPWVEDCLNLNFNGRPKEARALLRANLVKHLYKYRPLNDFTLENLEDNNFYLCKHTDLNDPYEFHPKLSIDAEFYNVINGPDFNTILTSEERNQIKNSSDRFRTFNEITQKKGHRSKIDKHSFEKDLLNEFHSKFKKAKDVFRICSLSERNDSTIMWSHYAEQHKGICIEYHSDDFMLNHPILPVMYDTILFELTDSVTENKSEFSYMLCKLMLSKALDWQYESEWRIMYLGVDEQNIGTNIYLPAPKPKAIYLGSRYNENTPFKRTQLEKIIERDNIPTFRMRIDYNDFKMIPIT